MATPTLQDNSNIPAGQLGSPWSTAVNGSGTPGQNHDPATGSGYNPANSSSPTYRYTTPPPAGTNTPSQDSTSPIDTYYNGLKTSVTPQDEATIREGARTDVQSYVDAVNAQYGQLTSNQAAANNNAAGENRATDARSGLLGSDFGNSHAATVADTGNKALATLASDQNAKIQGIYSTADQNAKAEIAAQKQAALGNQKALVDHLQTVQTQTQNNIKTLGANGVTVDQLKSADPTKYAQLLKDSGYSEFQLAQELLNSSNGQNKSDLKVEGNTAYLTTYNPTTGKVNTTTQQFNAPPGSLTTVGNNVYQTVTLPDGSTALKPMTPDKYSAAKDAMGNPIAFDSTTGKYLDMNGNPTTPAHTNDSTGLLDQPTVDTFLKGKSTTQTQAFNNLNDTEKSSVMQLINGDALLSDLMSSRGIQGSAARQQLLAEARSVDPTFSENVNKQRYAFQTEWNNPTSKAYITRDAINTGLGHLAELKQVSDQLNAGDIKKYNSLGQWITANTNGPQAAQVAQFQQVINLLAPEIAKAYAGGIPDVKSIEDEKNALLAINPKNVNASLINMTASLMNSKLDSTAQEYKNVMGNFPDNPIVHQDVLDKLQSSGIDTQGMTKSLIQQGMKASSVKDYETAFPQAATQVDKLVHDNPNLSEQDVLQILQGQSPYFNNVGADTNSGTSSPTAMRTDRNNNPTAMTTDVAKTAGLVYGKDYTQGDPFTSNGKTYYTAKLLGDPVATTIKALDNGGFYTASGQQRWTHTAMSQSQWNNMNYGQKKQVVAQMYQHEGGKALKNYFS